MIWSFDFMRFLALPFIIFFNHFQATSRGTAEPSLRLGSTSVFGRYLRQVYRKTQSLCELHEQLSDHSDFHWTLYWTEPGIQGVFEETREDCGLENAHVRVTILLVKMKYMMEYIFCLWIFIWLVKYNLCNWTFCSLNLKCSGL